MNTITGFQDPRAYALQTGLLPTFSTNVEYLCPVPADALGDLAGQARKPDLVLLTLVVAGVDAIGITEVSVKYAVNRRCGGGALPYHATRICGKIKNKFASENCVNFFGFLISKTHCWPEDNTMNRAK